MLAIPVLRRPRQEDYLPALHSKVEANLDYMARHCLKNERKKKREGRKSMREEGGREERGKEKREGRREGFQVSTPHKHAQRKKEGRQGEKRASQGGEEGIVYINHSFWLETSLIYISLSNYSEYIESWKTSLATKPLPPFIALFLYSSFEVMVILQLDYFVRRDILMKHAVTCW